MHTARVALLALLLLAAGAFAPAAGASAQEPEGEGLVGIRLLDAPEDRRDDPRAHIYIIDHLLPGRAIERRVEVFNETTQATDVELYTAGADIEDGSFSFFEGRGGNELAEWTSVDPPKVTVPAGGAAQATVRINVPPDASEGEHYAVVWAELPAATGGDVTVVNRVGVRIYLSVGPGGEPPSDFSIDDLTARRTAEGAPQVVAAVTNTGGRALDLSGELALRDGPGGLSAGPFPAQLVTTLGVGESGEVLVDLDSALPDGPWLAEVTLLSGDTERTASATISFPPAGEAETVTPDQGLPWWWVALGVLVLLLAVFAWWLLRRRRGSPARRAAAPGPASATIRREDVSLHERTPVRKEAGR